MLPNGIIRDGDIVSLFNERGACWQVPMSPSASCRDVFYIDHGSRYDPIVPGNSIGWCINTICPRHTTPRLRGHGYQRFSGAGGEDDIEELRRKYPEVFSRPYDAASGRPSREYYIEVKRKVESVYYRHYQVQRLLQLPDCLQG